MIRSLAERFLRPSIVGVDVESGEIRIAKVIKRGEKYILSFYAKGVVENHDTARSLDNLMIHAGLRKHDLAIGITSPNLVINPFRFPKIPKKELKAAIELEAEHLMAGQASSNMMLDWCVSKFSKNGSLQGLLAVIPRSFLETQIENIRASSRNLVVVDVNALALWNAYNVLKQPSDLVDKPELLIYIGQEATHLVIANRSDELIFARDIEIGRTALDKGQINEWLSEIRDSLAYARSKSGLRSIHQATLTGIDHPDILGTLEPLLGVPIRFWNVLDHLSCQVPIDRQEGLRMPIAVGLALRTFE